VTADALGRHEAWFHAVSFHAVLAALCPLVPVPLVDTLLLQQVRKSMTRSLALDLGVALSEPQVAVLAGAVDLDPGRGCLVGCFAASGKLGLAVLKQLVTKLVIFFTFKEGVENAAEVFYEGVLLQHALTAHRHVLPTTDDERQAGARQLRKAIDGVLADVQGGAILGIIGGVLRGARQALAEGARLLAKDRIARDEDAPLPVAEEAQVLEGVTTRLRDALWKEQETIVLLRRRLDERIA
jgi:uncharacterized protein (DUF697 family)